MPSKSKISCLYKRYENILAKNTKDFMLTKLGVHLSLQENMNKEAPMTRLQLISSNTTA